jgi:hypothetical protein
MEGLRKFFIFAMIGRAGCAGASVTQQAQQTPASNDHPTKVAVYPFAVDPGEVRLNSASFKGPTRVLLRPTRMRNKLRLPMTFRNQSACTLRRSLTDKGYNAVCLPRGAAPAGDNVVIVDGEFNNVSEGNRLSRTVISFGLGASTLEIDVYVI